MHLQRVVIVWLALGGIALAVTTQNAYQRGIYATFPWWFVPLAALLVLAGDALRIEFPLASRTLAVNLTEVGLVLALVLLPSPAVVLPVAFGVLSASLLLRETWLQHAFNTAVAATGASAAAIIVALIAEGGPFGTSPVNVLDPLGLLALVCAVLAYGLVNLVSYGMLLASLDGMAFDLAGRSMILSGITTLLLSGSLGIIAAVLLSAAPLALPALVLPVWIAQRALAERVARIQGDVSERDRLVRTVEGAKDGIALLDANGRVELANPAFRAGVARHTEDLVGASLFELVGGWRVESDARPGEPGAGPIDGVATPVGAAVTDVARSAAPDEAERVGDAVTALLQGLTPTAPDGSLNLRTGDRVYTLAVTGLFDQLGSRTGTVVLLVDVTASWEADQLRRDLLARVSHELRTPLTSIEGFIETLRARDTELTADQRSHYLAVVDRQARRLHRLVANLLWSARIERDRAEPQPASLLLRAAVPEALEALRELLPEPVTVEVGDLGIHADPDQLQQVLINLLTNAASYGRPPIAVRAHGDGVRVEVVVSDAGEGVSTAFLERIFEPLTQSSVGDRRTAAGLGLGLSIVRALLESNDGTIEYRRTAGRTEFAFTLPAAHQSS